MSGCHLCPRDCGAQRAAGQRGYCGADQRLLAARAAAHYWEEPCLSGSRGSGTVFFSGCGLGCVYCQNRPIALAQQGQAISVARLSEIFLELQAAGLHNINLVTGSQYTPEIVTALTAAKAQGLTVPVVWNSGGYEKVETLRRLEGLVDIWLPDLKYASPQPAARYSRAGDYFRWAAAAITEMVRQAPALRFDDQGLLLSGVIVRHLALPGQGRDSRAVLRWLHSRFGQQIYISLMSQYTPMPGIGHLYPELAQPLPPAEYQALVDYAMELGLVNCYIQEGGVAEASFIPPFDGQGL